MHHTLWVFAPDLLVNLQDWVSIYNEDLERIFIATLNWSSGRMQEIQSARFRVRALHGHREISAIKVRVWLGCGATYTVVWWGVAWVWYILHHTYTTPYLEKENTLDRP